ncbi:surface protease GP63 [Trypanosoma cruzi]|nr:surface protease GP63 [Trypanosoma cruzi]
MITCAPMHCSTHPLPLRSISSCSCLSRSSMETAMRIGSQPLSSSFAATVYACMAPCPLRGTSRTTAVVSGPFLLIITSNPQRYCVAGASAIHPLAQHISSNTTSGKGGVAWRGWRMT